jgi:hypothetical protein
MSTSAPDLPAGVLVQSLYVTDEGGESGWRVWDDGRHESRRGGGPWEETAMLDAQALATVREVLDDSDLAGMAGVHGMGDEPRQTAMLWFQAHSGGRPYTVALVGDARVEGLDSLTARLFAAIAGPGFPFSDT